MNLFSKNYSLLATRYSLRMAVAVHLLLFTLVVTGILPRAVVPFWALAVAAWAAVVPPRWSVALFAAAIPTFVAIPIATDFDNFNTWRIVAVVIFLRWFLSTQSLGSTVTAVRSFFRRPLAFPVTTALVGLAVIALVSVAQAADIAAALRRIVFFANAALVPLVAYALARQDTAWRRTLLRAIGWSAVLVTTVAFIQLASTYLMDVYAFMRIWGEGVQLKQFGALWSQIAVRVGNTWLAYYGPQLSLRVFSLFPDSHSFPVYLLMALGGVVAFALRPITKRIGDGVRSLKALARTRASLGIVWVPLGLLAVILSGTRGIWAAAIGLPLVFAVVAWWMRRTKTGEERRILWRYLFSLSTLFYFLFVIAWPIFVSPQFLLSKGDWGLLGNRVRSILDFGETSNSERLKIWGATLDSIRERPVLGVGIGNFPTVLDQRIILAKAGSSAHNVWLHVAAEMGVAALALFIWLWLIAYRSAYRVFTRAGDWAVVTYAGWILLALPWIAAYLLTDAALFDERALLLFGISVAFLRASDDTP